MRFLRVHLFIVAVFAALAAFSFSHIGCSDGGESEDDTTLMECEAACAPDCGDIVDGLCVCNAPSCAVE